MKSNSVFEVINISLKASIVILIVIFVRGLIGKTLALREGDRKHHLKHTLQWKKTTWKLSIISMIVCVITIILCAVNPRDTLISNPYEWSHSVSSEDIHSHSAFRWGEKEVKYYLSDKDIKDLIYALNGVSWKDYYQGNAIVDSEFTIALQCNDKEYLLTYGAGETMFSFENSEKRNRGVWKTDNTTLANSIKRIMNDSLQVEITEYKSQMQPTKEEVLEIRKKVLRGMTEEEIEQLTKLIHKGNHAGESDYLPANEFERYKEEESLYWSLFTDRGDVIIGYAFDSTSPLFVEANGLTIEEYNEKYGTPVVISDNVPIREKFYTYIDSIEKLLKTNLLDDDINEMKQYMDIAIENHDVKCLYEIYYRLHDLDYYLFQYGPQDVSHDVAYASSIEIFYGRLHIYSGVLPTTVKKYDLSDKSYYKMSDGTWRMGIYSYKYMLELKGKIEERNSEMHFVLLSNRKDVSFEEVWKAKDEEKFPIEEWSIVLQW